MRLKTILSILLCSLLFTNCKEPFNPEIPAQKTNFLVVEGFIDAGNEPTNIRISRATDWDEAGNLKPENGATVRVEGSDNSSFLLGEKGNGLYSALFAINKAVQYRVRIKTKTNEEYTSDFVSVKITPPIDSLNWRIEDNNLKIFVNSHDPQNQTNYYTWSYNETWQIRSTFYALYESKNGSIVLRDLSVNIYDCWKYDSSKSILLGSSAKLQSDVIFEHPLISISKGAERMGIRYSLLVKQYALSKEAYEFFELLKKNTESIGTIFDPQPSLLKTNIRNQTGEKNVIGFIYAASKQEKRIFIDNNELPGWRYTPDCQSDRITNHPDSIKARIPPAWPYDADRFGPAIIGWFVSTPDCVDCRLRGGSNVKPSYW